MLGTKARRRWPAPTAQCCPFEAGGPRGAPSHCAHLPVIIVACRIRSLLCHVVTFEALSRVSLFLAGEAAAISRCFARSLQNAAVSKHLCKRDGGRKSNQHYPCSGRRHGGEGQLGAPWCVHSLAARGGVSMCSGRACCVAAPAAPLALAGRRLRKSDPRARTKPPWACLMNTRLSARVVQLLSSSWFQKLQPRR